MTGVWLEVQTPAMSAIYTLIIIHADAATRLQDRLAVMLDTNVARRWRGPGRCRRTCWWHVRPRRCRPGAVVNSRSRGLAERVWQPRSVLVRHVRQAAPRPL